MFRYFAICVAICATATASAQPVYKHTDESGATVYSDRADAPASAETTKVQLPPAPSEAEQNAAIRRMEGMQQQTETMKSERLTKEKQRAEAKETEEAIEGQITGTGTTVDARRRDPKQLIPNESPTGGGHPVYNPNGSPPVHGIPRPTRRVGR